MKSKRDDFTKLTTEILGKRVAYLCSNPNCKKSTIGAHTHIDKSSSIGIAAHLTAASNRGPRYDSSLTKEQRKHISNGIWLCSNCASLIDKDEKKYTKDILIKWKEAAEEETRKKLNGEIINNPVGNPYLEVDLILTTRGRINRGYSDQNPIEIEDGIPIMIMTDRPIIYWEIFWGFNFVIFNNSSYPAYNVKIESVGSEHFRQIDILPRINNLPPLEHLDLEAKYSDFAEGDYLIADRIQKLKIPENFKHLKLNLTYYDEAKNLHINRIEFSASEILNNSTRH